MASSTLDLVRRSWVEWAEKLYAEQHLAYEKYEDYYEGDQEIVFATDRWKQAFGTVFQDFSDNWCQVVVDSMVQRLQITGWSCEDKELANLADEIYFSPDVLISMQAEEEDLHTQTAVKGDGYLIVWPDTTTAEDPWTFYNDATEVNIHYSGRNRRIPTRASKKFQDENGDIHLYIYFPDHTEHFMVPSNLTQAQIATGTLQIQFQDVIGLPLGWEKAEADIDNPYGRLPVIHFRNRALGRSHGISELKPVIPIQNAVNKILMDLMIGSEFGSFRQKWMSGGGHPPDGWRAGAERVWATTDANAKFGEFGQIDLEPIFKAAESLMGHLAKVTQTPLHYLRAQGDMPSGEALKMAESGLIRKCESRQRQWGWSWAEAMNLALWMRLGDKPSKLVKPVWKSAETRHILEDAQTSQLKAILGIPLEVLWKEHFGYSDQEIDEFKKSNRASFASMLAQVLAQNGQLPPGISLEEIGTQNLPQLLAQLPKGLVSQTPAGEATTNPQPNTRPPGSPTRRSSGFKG